MTQQQFSQDNIPDPNEVARQLMDRCRWQLTTPDELVRRASTLAQLPHGSLTKALVGAYCITLYTAFLGEHGLEQQHRACEELGGTIAGLITKNYPDVPNDERADITQDTIMRVWRARENCREPIAFLAFVASHLLTATQYAGRQLQRIGEPLKPWSDDDDDAGDLPDSQPSALDQIVQTEQHTEVKQFFVELRKACPRAHDQIKMLELHVIQGMTSAEIAHYLHINPEVVYQKLTRIRRTIRKHTELCQRARELGIT